MSTDRKIPEAEHGNVLSVYWQMLRELEERIDPNNKLDNLLVTGGYNVLNRIGVTNQRPRWENENDLTGNG